MARRTESPRSFVRTLNARGRPVWLLAVETGVDRVTGEVLFGTQPIRKPSRWIPGDQFIDVTGRELQSFRVPIVLRADGQPNKSFKRMREVAPNDRAKVFGMRVVVQRLAAGERGFRRAQAVANARPVARFADGRIRRFQSIDTFALLLVNRDRYFGAKGREDPYEAGGAQGFLSSVDPVTGFPSSDFIGVGQI